MSSVINFLNGELLFFVEWENQQSQREKFKQIDFPQERKLNYYILFALGNIPSQQNSMASRIGIESADLTLDYTNIVIIKLTKNTFMASCSYLLDFARL